jgi:hypothetical protein
MHRGTGPRGMGQTDMTEPTTSDYDIVMGVLETMANGRGADAINAMADMVELTQLHRSWVESGRRSNPKNMALLQWVGRGGPTRVAFVLRVIGFTN